MLQKSIFLNRSVKIFLLSSILAIAPAIAWGELVIRVTQGNDKPTIVAISPMVLAGAQLSEDISSIVESDLERSGLFKVVPRNNMLSFPSDADDVYFRDWRLLGSEYLLVGAVTKGDDLIELSFSLLNVNAQNTVFKHSCLLYTSPSPRDRSLSRMPSSA